MRKAKNQANETVQFSNGQLTLFSLYPLRILRQLSGTLEETRLHEELYISGHQALFFFQVTVLVMLHERSARRGSQYSAESERSKGPEKAPANASDLALLNPKEKNDYLSSLSRPRE